MVTVSDTQRFVVVKQEKTNCVQKVYFAVNFVSTIYINAKELLLKKHR